MFTSPFSSLASHFARSTTTLSRLTLQWVLIMFCTAFKDSCEIWGHTFNVVSDAATWSQAAKGTSWRHDTEHCSLLLLGHHLGFIGDHPGLIHTISEEILLHNALQETPPRTVHPCPSLLVLNSSSQSCVCKDWCGWYPSIWEWSGGYFW